MINYPNKKNSFNKVKIEHANRGMNLEEIINNTNLFYLEENIAVIHKKPTPIQVLKIDYQDKGKIKEAYFKSPSTTDYNGVYKGKYVDFEAKETISKTSFPFSNISTHQIEHLRKVINQQGIAFLIISFSYLQEIYFLEAKIMIEYMESSKRKSIPYSLIKEKGHLLNQSFFGRIDYLKIIDDFYC